MISDFNSEFYHFGDSARRVFSAIRVVDRNGKWEVLCVDPVPFYEVPINTTAGTAAVKQGFYSEVLSVVESADNHV